MSVRNLHPALSDNSDKYEFFGWNVANFSFTGELLGVAINSNDLCVAVGINASGYPVGTYSSDGINWATPAIMNGTSTIVTMSGIAVNSSGLFVSVGTSRTGPSSWVIMTSYSSDGISWSEPALFNGSSVNANIGPGSHSITVNSSGLFVAAATQQFASYPYTIPLTSYSSDGISWSTPTQILAAAAGSFPLIGVNSSGLFVMLGQVSGGNTTILSSSDGSTWSGPTVVASSITEILDLMVTSQDFWIAVGNTSHPVSAYSIDGLTWSAFSQINSLTGFVPYCVGFNGDYFVALSNAIGSPYYPDGSYSFDGINWVFTGTVTAPPIAHHYINAVAANSKGRFVGVGNTYCPIIYSSIKKQ